MVLQVEISSRVGLRGPWWPWTTSGKTESARGPWGRLGSGLFFLMEIGARGWCCISGQRIDSKQLSSSVQLLCLIALWCALQW